MKIQIKQKMMAFTDSFYVKSDGKDIYHVSDKIFSFGHQMVVENMEGEEVALIKEELFCFQPTFNVYINGNRVTGIQKKFTVLKDKYKLDSLGWSVKGNVLDREYDVKDGFRRVMSIKKKFFAMTDTYELDIKNPDEHLLCICVAIAIDCALCDN